MPAVFFNQPEPWDGDGLAYPIALLCGGLVLGFLGAGHIGLTVLAVFAGQLLVLLGRVILSPATSELWVVGVLFLAMYSLVCTGVGALLGTMLRRRVKTGHAPRA